MSVDFLLGATVKSITEAGAVVLQDADGIEQTLTLSVGGAIITSGEADPAGGTDGDAHFQVDASDVLQSIWHNFADTWTEYTLPSAGTVETGDPVSGDGSTGDPVTIANRAISHLKLGSTVGGVNQAARHIQEADGSGGMRWAENNALSADEAEAAYRLLDEVLGAPANEDLYTLKTYFGDIFVVVPRTYDTTASFAESARYSDVVWAVGRAGRYLPLARGSSFQFPAAKRAER